MRKIISKTAVPVSLGLWVLLGGCTAFTEHRTGLVDGRLTACPEWPRCVSSQARDPEKQVPPLAIRGEVRAAWETAVDRVAAMNRTTIVDRQDDYLHAEVVSPWHVYTDDLELLLQPQARLIQVRSSGRIGYYDFQVNRERVEALRDELIEQGVVQPR